MANIDKPKSIFYGVMQALRGQKDPAKSIQQNREVLTGSPAPNVQDANFIQQKQQEYLDIQSVKIAQDLYSRTLYYDTDRITAYNDFRSMDLTPEIAAALDIISDEVCTRNERGNVITIYSDNLRIKKVLQELFYRTLNAEFNLSFWTRELCKYGDCFLKLEVDQNEGIYDCMMLPVGEIHKEVGYDGNPKSTRYKWDINNMFFEEWQISHFCLLYDAARLPYGRSILDPARKLWKQLQLAEDAMLVYRLCLQGETRIRTNNGYKFIKDLEIGDTIVSFNENSELEYGKVKHQINNGKKSLYKVRSKHIELIGTETHPVLVSRNGILQYVDIKDLRTKEDKLINVKFEEFGVEEKKIEKITGEVFAKIKEEKIDFFKNKKIENKTALMKECALEGKYDHTRIKQFLYSKGKGLPYELAVSVCEKMDFDTRDLVLFEKGQMYSERINVPEFVDEEFAGLFGFLLGDGFIWKNGIGFSEGMDEGVNKKYSSLLEKYFSKVSYEADRRPGRKYGKYVVTSTAAAKIFRNLGYISGSKNKRIPSWVFNCRKSIRKALVEGLSDADGCERHTKSGLWFSTIELTNKHLVEDIKELWTSVGLCSGHIRHRERNDEHIIEGTRKISGGKSWGVTISENTLPEHENVLSVEYFGEEDVFDITVDNRLHNFVANGTPVHNTRAPERRIFYIEVGNTDPNDVVQLIEQVKKSIKKSPVVDPSSGRVNLKYNPISYEEDYFLPVRGDKSSKIETLPGAANLDQISDIEYLQNKLFAAIKVPKTYLNYAESMPGGSTLSQVDLRFSRTINRIQEQIVLELRRVANIHLYFLGFEDDLDNFTITLTNPSTQLELLKLETWKARLEVFKELFSSEATAPVSYSWAMEYILGFSKSEIKQIIRQKKVERKMFAEIERANDEYMDTGIFKELDDKFRKPDFDAGAGAAGAPPAEPGADAGGGGGGSVLPGLGAGGGEMPIGGPPEAGGAPEAGAPEAGAPEAGGEAPPAEEAPPIAENILISENRKFDIQTRKLMKSIDSYLSKINNQMGESPEVDESEE